MQQEERETTKKPESKHGGREPYIWKDGVARVERPMDMYLKEVLDKLSQKQVVVVQAETGVGKTSRIPQAIMDSQPNTKIYMTQPRRYAVRMNAGYIAREKKQRLGQDVDFTLRGVPGENSQDKKASRDAKLEVMIDETLVNRILREKKLPDGVIIVDEAHERSINIDLLLLLIRTYLPNSPNTKILITSATIDTQKFKGYFKYSPEELTAYSGKESELDFAAEPVIALNEKLFRVETEMIHLNSGEHHTTKAIETAVEVFKQFVVGKTEAGLKDRVLAEEERIYREKGFISFSVLPVPQPLTIPPEQEGDARIPVADGTVLVFLPGKEEIAEGVRVLKEYARKIGCSEYVECLSMYRGVDDAERNAIEAPIVPGKLRVIFTTEILKSSVTPTKTVVVIDSFQVKRDVENEHGVSVLRKVSQSGAESEQAKGRGGRTNTTVYKPVVGGIDEVLSMQEESGDYWPQPAILREGIISVTLKMAAAGLDIKTAKLLDRPNQKNVDRAVIRLQQINALDDEGRITSFGRELLRFSIAPEQAKALFEGEKQGVLPESMIALAVASEEGIFSLPPRGMRELICSEVDLQSGLERYLATKWLREIHYSFSGIAQDSGELQEKFQAIQREKWGEVRLAFKDSYLNSARYPVYINTLEAKNLWQHVEQTRIYDGRQMIDGLLLDYVRELVFDKLSSSSITIPTTQESLHADLMKIKATINVKLTQFGGAPLEMRFNPTVLSELTFPLGYGIVRSEVIKQALQFRVENEDDILLDVFNIRYDQGFFRVKSSENDSSIPNDFFSTILCPDCKVRNRDSDLDEHDYRKQIYEKRWLQFALDQDGQQTNSDFVASVNAFRAYKQAKRQMSDNQLWLWCQANGLNLKKMQQVDTRLSYLIDEVEKSRLSLSENVSSRRAFSSDALTKAMLAGLAANVCFGQSGPVAPLISASKESALNGKAPYYIFGGIRKSEIKPRKLEHHLHFASLCAPIKLEWLEEISPQLCTKKRIENSAAITPEGAVKFNFNQYYIGHQYEMGSYVVDGIIAQEALASFIFAKKLTHPDHQRNLEVIAEAHSVLLRSKQVRVLETLVEDWYKSKFKGLSTVAEIENVSLALTPEILTELLGLDYAKLKAEVEATIPDEVTIRGVQYSVTYRLGGGKFFQDLSLPNTVAAELLLHDLPNSPQGFERTIVVSFESGASTTRRVVTTEENLKELQQEVEKKRKELVWQQFISANSAHLRKTYFDSGYFWHESASQDRKKIIVADGDPLPLEVLPTQAIWDEQTGSQCYYYFERDPYSSLTGSKAYNIRVFNNEEEYLERKATINSEREELLREKQRKVDAVRFEMETKAMVASADAMLKSFDLSQHLRYGLTARQVESGYYADDVVSLFARLLAVKKSIGWFNGYSGTPDWKEARRLMLQLNAELTEAQEKYDSPDINAKTTAAFMGEEALFNSEGFTIPQKIGKLNGEINLGMRRSQENNRWYLVMSDDDGIWSNYKGAYSSRFSGGYESQGLLLRAVKAQFAEYGYSFVPVENLAVAEVSPEALRDSRFRDLIFRQSEHEGVFTGYRYVDTQGPWELVYMKKTAGTEGWELHCLDLETGEIQGPKVFNDSRQFRFVENLSDIGGQMTRLGDRSFINRTDGGITNSRFQKLETLESGLKRFMGGTGGSSRVPAVFAPEVRTSTRKPEPQRAPAVVPQPEPFVYRRPPDRVIDRQELAPIEKAKIYAYLQSSEVSLRENIAKIESGKDSQSIRQTPEWRSAFIKAMLNPDGLAAILEMSWSSDLLKQTTDILTKAVNSWINEYESRRNFGENLDQKSLDELRVAQGIFEYVQPMRSFISRNRANIADYVGGDRESITAFYTGLLLYSQTNGVAVLHNKTVVDEKNKRSDEQIIEEVLDSIPII